MPFSYFFPAVKAQAEEEEELVDPHETLKSDCASKSNCAAFKEKFDECTDRVSSRSQTTETCTEELFDFIHCVDHCVSHSLFSKLK